MVPGLRTWLIPDLRTPAPADIWTPLTFVPRTRPTFSFWAPVGLLPGTWVGLRLRARAVLGVRVGRGTGRPDRLVRWGAISVALLRPNLALLAGCIRWRAMGFGTVVRNGRPGTIPEEPTVPVGRRRRLPRGLAWVVGGR